MAALPGGEITGGGSEDGYAALVAPIIGVRQAGHPDGTATHHYSLAQRQISPDSLAIGCSLGLPASLDPFDQKPFAFHGTIGIMKIWNPKKLESNCPCPPPVAVAANDLNNHDNIKQQNKKDKR
ncbi:MAG: hypothetical protein ACLP2Y_12415 [Limisphaerales bacterium]